MADNVTGRAAMAEPYENVPLALEEEEDSIDLIALFQVLRRGKRTILGVTLAVFVLATAIAFLLPRRFTSTVSFIPPALSNGNSMAATLAGQLSAIGGGDLFGGAKTSGDLYAGILESRSIASELVKNFHLMDVYRVKKESEAEKALASNTAVTVDQKSTIVTVNVTDKEPERARDLANAYMDALRETNGRARPQPVVSAPAIFWTTARQGEGRSGRCRGGTEENRRAVRSDRALWTDRGRDQVHCG